MPSVLAAVIGHPISQSLSPVMHQGWMVDAAIDGDYQGIDVQPDALADFMSGFRLGHIVGLNVTVPHKEAIIPFLDRLAPSAMRVGAVNTVKRMEDGSLVGFNTDGIGFMRHLRASAPHWPISRPPLILGAGGAARGIIPSLLDQDIPFLMVSNRSIDRVSKLVDDFGGGRMTIVDWQDRSAAVSGAGLIINTTSLGMTGQPDLDIALTSAAADTVVYDIVYKPLETSLLAAAHARGLATVDGLGMLIHQGAAAFEIWFGQKPVITDGLRTRLLEGIAP